MTGRFTFNFLAEARAINFREILHDHFLNISLQKFVLELLGESDKVFKLSVKREVSSLDRNHLLAGHTPGSKVVFPLSIITIYGIPYRTLFCRTKMDGQDLGLGVGRE